jgi:hypothetical protein
MHYEYADECCETQAPELAQTFFTPDSLRASLVNTADAAQQRIDEIEAELYAQRLLLDAARNGLSTIERVQLPQGCCEVRG